MKRIIMIEWEVKTQTMKGWVGNTNAGLKLMKTYTEHLPAQFQSSHLAIDHIQVTFNKGLFFIISQLWELDFVFKLSIMFCFFSYV